MKLLFCGDLHGALDDADRAIYLAQEQGAYEIVQLGDWGFLWPGRDEMSELDHMLSESGVHMRFIDGNHDDHLRLRRYLEPGERGGMRLTDNVTYQPRGSVHVYPDGARVGFLGGAISIDKKHRTEGRSWWPEEEVTEDESRLFDGIDPVDILCLHDSPIIPLDLNPLSPKLTEECDHHRALVARAAAAAGPALILHGHYHLRHSCSFHGARVEGLSYGYSALDEYTLLVDTDEFRRTK